MLATIFHSQFMRLRMRDLELWPDEKFLSQEEAWLRIASHLDPGVRRDIVGWMGGRDRSKRIESRSSIRQQLMDYIRGAAMVIDPFPRTPIAWETSDSQALRKDALAIGDDTKTVALLMRELLREQAPSVEQRERRKPAE